MDNKWDRKFANDSQTGDELITEICKDVFDAGGSALARASTITSFMISMNSSFWLKLRLCDVGDGA